MTISTLMNYRWLRFTLLGGLAVIVIAVALAYTMIDSRKIAALATNAVEQQTGRSLKLNGPVSLKLFPHPSIVAEEVVLGNAPWAADPVMLQVAHIELAAQWLPLLHRQVLIDHVELQGVTLNLQAAPAGQPVAGNWILTTAKASDAADKTQSASGGELFDLRSVALSDVSIHLKDAAGMQTQSVGIDQLTGSLSDTQTNFSGRVRWQKQPLDIKGLVEFKPDSPLNVSLNLQADRLDLKSAANASSAVNEGAKPASSAWVFGTSPLGLDVLPLWHGTFDVAIKTLVLPSGVVLPDFSTQITLSPESAGMLRIARLQAGLGQGMLYADGTITGYAGKNPQFSVRGSAKGFTLEQVITQANAGKKSNMVQGGPTQAAFNLAASGQSPRELASSVSGQVQVSVGQATVNGALLNDGGDFVMSLLNAVNPLRKSSGENPLQCAVAYLPVRNGLLSIAQSVGIETDRLNVILDGQVNLKNEMLNMRIYPTERTGLTTGVNAAGLVQVSGTLRNPKLGVNKSGVVKQTANVGLAIMTAGISLAVQNVAAIATKRSPCDNVLRPWETIDGQMLSR